LLKAREILPISAKHGEDFTERRPGLHFDLAVEIACYHDRRFEQRWRCSECSGGPSCAQGRAPVGYVWLREAFQWVRIHILF
jgi:hypothetical protein